MSDSDQIEKWKDEFLDFLKSHTRPLHYKLEGREIVPIKPEDWLEWAEWFETFNRHIAEDVKDDVRVSTVFLGIDHRHWGGEEELPLLFETMVFGGKYDGYQFRYSTYHEAEVGHARVCDQVGIIDILSAEVIY